MNNYDLSLNLSDCHFWKDHKMLHVAHSRLENCFPETVEVFSHHTGRTVKFVQNDEYSAENEWWDGEQMVYFPEIPLPHVEKLIMVYNF